MAGPLPPWMQGDTPVSAINGSATSTKAAPLPDFMKGDTPVNEVSTPAPFLDDKTRDLAAKDNEVYKDELTKLINKPGTTVDDVKRFDAEVGRTNPTGDNYQSIKDNLDYIKKNGPNTPSFVDPLNPLAKGALGAVRGVQHVIEGAAQLGTRAAGATGIIAPETATNAQKAIKDFSDRADARFEQGTAGKVGAFIGESAALPIPAIKGAKVIRAGEEVAAPFLSGANALRTVKLAATGAAAGAVTGAEATGADQDAKALLGGALTALGTPLVEALVSKVGVPAANALFDRWKQGVGKKIYDDTGNLTPYGRVFRVRLLHAAPGIDPDLVDASMAQIQKTNPKQLPATKDVVPEMLAQKENVPLTTGMKTRDAKKMQDFESTMTGARGTQGSQDKALGIDSDIDEAILNNIGTIRDKPTTLTKPLTVGAPKGTVTFKDALTHANGDQHVAFKYNTPDGRSVLGFVTVPVKETDAKINVMGRIGTDSNTFGPTAVKEVAAAIKAQYPQLKSLSGVRISGAKKAAGLNTAKGSIPLETTTTLTSTGSNAAAADSIGNSVATAAKKAQDTKNALYAPLNQSAERLTRPTDLLGVRDSVIDTLGESGYRTLRKTNKDTAAYIDELSELGRKKNVPFGDLWSLSKRVNEAARAKDASGTLITLKKNLNDYINNATPDAFESGDRGVFDQLQKANAANRDYKSKFFPKALKGMTDSAGMSVQQIRAMANDPDYGPEFIEKAVFGSAKALDSASAKKAAASVNRIVKAAPETQQRLKEITLNRLIDNMSDGVSKVTGSPSLSPAKASTAISDTVENNRSLLTAVGLNDNEITRLKANAYLASLKVPPSGARQRGSSATQRGALAFKQALVRALSTGGAFAGVSLHEGAGPMVASALAATAGAGAAALKSSKVTRDALSQAAAKAPVDLGAIAIGRGNVKVPLTSIIGRGTRTAASKAGKPNND